MWLRLPIRKCNFLKKLNVVILINLIVEYDYEFSTMDFLRVTLVSVKES